jgi:hypothetical protein
MSTKKRFYFKEETKTVTNKTGYVEIETDFTQVYDAFSELTPKLKSPCTVSLLFWLLSHEANKNNNITSGKSVYERFVKHLEGNGGKSVTERTFHNSYEELVNVGACTKVGRGHYYVNPHFFWRGDKKSRLEFIIDETKDNKFHSLNPATENNKPKLLQLKKVK